MIIALDFDGTIANSQNIDEIEYPNMGVINKAKELRKKGHKLILWTCRGGDWLKEAIDFCKFYDLEFDSINENIKGIDYIKISNKVVADLYVDDKSPGSIKHFLNLNF